MYNSPKINHMRFSLNNSQRKVLVEICVAVGQLAAASMVLPFVVPGFDQAKLFVITLGLLITIGAWFWAVMLARKIK